MASSKEHIMPERLWEHAEPTSTDLYKFMKRAERATGQSFPDYDALHEWSCKHRSDFWRFTFNYFPIIYSGEVPDVVVDEGARIDEIPTWFRGVKLNFAENILFAGNKHGQRTKDFRKQDDEVACIAVREGSFLEPLQYITWKELRDRVGQLSQAMRARGVRKGDRIALVASNSIVSLTVFLAATAIGALFSSSSTDMGITAILDRLTQIAPKFIFMDDWAIYNQKKIDLRNKMTEIVEGIKHLQEFQGVISQARFFEDPADISTIPKCQTWEDFISAVTTSGLVFEQLDFCDPMIILYSSGTTGQPKCIVHSVGGLVLNGHKESRLHRCVDSSSTQLQFTTTGWMMYMSSIQLLLTGATLILYDGSPFIPKIQNFFQLLEEQKVTHLGISPPFMQTLQYNKVKPKDITNLSSLKVVTSTGAILSEGQFEWFYNHAFPSSVHLCNISGGTDIAAAFGTGNPLRPVYAGGCQCISLGMAVTVFDSNIDYGSKILDATIPDGRLGELVCTEAFPTMPKCFWNDCKGQKYHNSYFGKCDGCWHHGDMIMIHPRTKHVIFFGRSDGVLNPSGIRFGSAEIYNVIEARFPDTIADSICVGQRRPHDTNENVMLFLLMRSGEHLDEALVRNVRAAVRRDLSPRHVPRYVFETAEIPYTINGKKVEFLVKKIVSGEAVTPSATLKNPKSLDFYYRFARDEYLKQGRTGKL